jgi:uncharacterized protein (TIGR02271 family)
MATENKNRNTRLQKLSGSDYEIVDGQPDITGWDVKDSNGKQIGEVDELLFDEQSRKVRYLVVDLDDNELDLDDKEVLIPIGIAQLHDDDDDVILPGVTAEHLRSLPAYDEDDFDLEKEHSIRNIFAGLGTGAAAASTGTDFYDHDHFNDENLYRNRMQNKNESETIPVIKEELNVGKEEVETGGVRLRSRVVETPVSEDISLRQETVNVERTDVDRSATREDLANAESEIEMRETEEVPVVNKEARVVEEIRVTKDVNERDEVINDSARNTEVDIDRDDEDREYKQDRDRS